MYKDSSKMAQNCQIIFSYLIYEMILVNIKYIAEYQVNIIFQIRSKKNIFCDFMHFLHFHLFSTFCDFMHLHFQIKN